MQDAKEEVRARLNIEDVIGEYVQLKRAGRNFKGLSPFSSEKTPSFFVSPDKQIWHDFSSNRGGDIYSFVMEAEGMDFRQALEFLARKAGVDLSMYQTAGNRRVAERKNRLLEAHALAVRYYQTSLVRSEFAIDYVFRGRKIDRATAGDFLLGYAPDTGSALHNFLTKKGFSGQEIAEAGLANRYGGDLFRGRMMVPLMDPSGQVIGFTGRIIGEVENAPKYLNTPQTLLYDKGRHVFGLSQAKESIRKANYAVVVEGNLDVVSSHQVGVCQVVATAGTAMTEHHLRALGRLTQDIRLCFDGDKAGIAATERAVEIGSQLGVELSVISLPSTAKDPDELIQESVETWREVVAQPTPAVDWVIAQYVEREDLTTASGKRAFTSAALALVGRLSDGVEREHYIDIIAEKIGSSREAIERKALLLTESTAQPRMKPVRETTETLGSEKTYVYEDELLALACAHAESQKLFARLDPGLLHGEFRQELARYFAAHAGQQVETAPESLAQWQTEIDKLQLRGETQFGEWSGDDMQFQAAKLGRRVEYEGLIVARDKLTAQLREAEALEDEPTANSLRGQLNELIKQIARKW